MADRHATRRGPIYQGPELLSGKELLNKADRLLTKPDQFLARNYVRWRGERRGGCLSTFLFHGLFRDPSEFRSQEWDSQQGITLEHFEAFIEYFLALGYAFVGQTDILEGLDPEKKHVLITFDDGYFNNTHAVDILKKLRVPALFFISTNYVLEEKAFWWDVVVRERIKRGASRETVRQEQIYLKSKRSDEIDQYIFDQFGAGALKPVGDVDRPLTVAELRDLSQQPFVEIGNHTCHHAILPNHSFFEIRKEIFQAQDHLQEITRTRPVAIAYPNGHFSDETVAVAKEAGLKLGITTWEEKNYLPLSGNDLFFLKRFTLWGSEPFIGECDRARSDFQPKSLLRRFLKKI
jgi:peptidoglycan/xylan/chitin deacetylase (PgdA/CDA1 family)